MPAKSGVGGGIVAVLPGQLGIGVYSPLLDDKGNSIRGVRVCRSLSQRLGQHFLTVTRESRSTIRTISDACDRVRVYELHGDLLFAGTEQVLRRVDREKDDFDVAILDVRRVDTINDAARGLLAGMRATLSSVGKEGFLVDPDNAVVRAENQDDFDRWCSARSTRRSRPRKLSKLGSEPGAPRRTAGRSHVGTLNSGTAKRDAVTRL
jgi:glutaminase